MGSPGRTQEPQASAPADHGLARHGTWPEPWASMPWELLATGRRSKGRVFVTSGADGDLVAKDASETRGRGLGAWVRRWTHRNEVAALRDLADVPGIPRMIADWDTGFVMQRVPGRSLREIRNRRPPPNVFDDVDAILAAIHAHGRVVIDVHRKNIIISDTGVVHLVDFELAIRVDRGLWSFLRRPLQAMDRMCTAKMRLRHGGQLEDHHQAELGPWRLRAYTLTRRIKKLRRRLLGRG